MRVHEKLEVVPKRCDLCGDTNPTNWWYASFPDVVVPGVAPDPDHPGMYMPLMFPNSEPWGVCGPCKIAIDDYSDLHTQTLLVRASTFMNPAVWWQINRIYIVLASTSHDPWERFTPPAMGVRHSFIERTLQ